MDADIRALIEHYDFRPLPVEGTLFAQSYLSRARTSEGERVGSGIIGLFCDEPRSFSCFHTLTHDELWHFYAGDPLHLILLHDDGSSETVILGTDFAAGQHVQYTVPSGVMQAGELVPGGRYALYGCTMAPGFTPAGFGAESAETMIPKWPDRADDIRRLSVAGDLEFPPED